MKRSGINNIIRNEEAFFRENHFCLLKRASRDLEIWQKADRNVQK